MCGEYLFLREPCRSVLAKLAEQTDNQDSWIQLVYLHLGECKSLLDVSELLLEFQRSTPRHVICQLVRMSVFCVLQVVNQFLLSVFLFPGDLAALQVPQKNVEVIQGKTVVLQASYTGSEIQKNTVVWNYMSSSTEMVTVFCYVLLFFVCVGSDSSVL